jgi:glutamyl-tRNA synthetase
MEELIQTFSISRINKSGARFDIEKAKWFNQHYIKEKDDAALAQTLLQICASHEEPCSESKAVHIVRLMKERITFPHELWSKGQFFFRAPEAYDEKVVKKKWNEDVANMLGIYANRINDKEEISAAEAHALLQEVVDEADFPIGKVLPALRLTLTGGATGPDLMGIIEVLGTGEVNSRIKRALEKIDQS